MLKIKLEKANESYCEEELDANTLFTDNTKDTSPEAEQLKQALNKL